MHERPPKTEECLPKMHQRPPKMNEALSEKDE